MPETGPPVDSDNRAASYAQLSKDDLYVELDRLIQPTNYAYDPSPEERKREGESIWRSFRLKLTTLVCKGRPKGGNPSIAALITAGGTAFIQETAKMILGAGVLPGVTEAVATAAAGLLYKEVQSGIDDFCDAYYTPEDED